MFDITFLPDEKVVFGIIPAQLVSSEVKNKGC